MPVIENKRFKVLCHVGQAVALPSKQKYKIRVTVGGKELVFEPKKL